MSLSWREHVWNAGESPHPVLFLPSCSVAQDTTVPLNPPSLSSWKCLHLIPFLVPWLLNAMCLTFFVFLSHLPEANPPVAFTESVKDQWFLSPTCLKNVFYFILTLKWQFGLVWNDRVFLRILRKLLQILLVSSANVEESNANLLSGPLCVCDLWFFSFWRYVESPLYPRCSEICLVICSIFQTLYRIFS